MTELMTPDQELAAQKCASCPKMCRSACPTLAVTRNERHQPWGHARQIVAALRAGETGFVDPDLVDSVYTCATCSACTPPCHVDGVETPLLTWEARAAVHRAGATPQAGIEAMRQAAAGEVPGPTDPSATLQALHALATPHADLLFFPGCGALGRRPNAVLAAARALHAVGMAFAVPAKHECCGMVARTFGDPLSADSLRSAVLHGGARRITVQSPSCAWHLAQGAALHGVEVEPLAATLARAAAQRTPAQHNAQPSVAYHDPCYLARHQRVRDEPRAVLRAAGYDVRELPHHGDATRCSGQGGGLPLTHPDIAAGYLQLLVDDVRAAGVDTVVTGCASCASALQDAGVDATELSEAVAAAVEEEG